MKSIGQQITTMRRLYSWLDDNIDKLYEDPALKSKFAPKKKMTKNNDIEQVIAAKSIWYQKEEFKNRMMDFMERSIITRRRKLRFKKVEYMKEATSPKIEYRAKNQFLE